MCERKRGRAIAYERYFLRQFHVQTQQNIELSNKTSLKYNNLTKAIGNNRNRPKKREREKKNICIVAKATKTSVCFYVSLQKELLCIQSVVVNL